MLFSFQEKRKELATKKEETKKISRDRENQNCFIYKPV